MKKLRDAMPPNIPGSIEMNETAEKHPSSVSFQPNSELNKKENTAIFEITRDMRKAIKI
jgi:hypothetical protein